MNIANLALGGGIFFILVFIHFVVDWIFQTHKEAIVKHNNPVVRAKHCSVYSIGFIPFMFVFKLELWEIYSALGILFWSHFYLDTYHVVFLWTKYIRKPAEMQEENNKEGFLKFASTPLGKILVIVVDQLTHMVFLIPLVWMALN